MVRSSGTGGEYHEIVPYEKIVPSMHFADDDEGAYNVTLFEDLANGETKLTLIGNETMERTRRERAG